VSESTYIPVKFLQEALRQAFLKFYPEETAMALAIMHAQMHAKFARSLGTLPVSDGDVRKTIRRSPVSARFQGHPEVLGLGDPLRGDRCVGKELVEQEILDCMSSLGGHVTAVRLQAELPDLRMSVPMCRAALKTLEQQGKIKQVGTGPRGIRYFSVAESVGSLAELGFEHRKA
jgi:hypothetical protein